MTARPSQPDFRTLFESAPGLYLVIAPDVPRYTIVAVSDAYTRQTLTKREAIVGKGLFEVFPDNPDDPGTTAVKNTSASLSRVIATRAPDAMPMQRHDIRRPPDASGGFEERWWSPVNSPIFGPRGELAYILHRVEDVTALVRQKRAGEQARQQASEELSRSEQQLRELFESAPDGIFIADPDGRYTDVNAAGCHLLGYSREELVGRSIVEFVPPEELPRQAALKQRILEGGAEVSEWELRRKDGSYVPVELSSNALPDGRLRAFIRDITGRREAEERLRLSEAKFSGIISIAADAIISIDDEHRITLFNDGAENTFGYARAEVLDAPLDMLIPERLRARHREHVRAFAAGDIGARHMGERRAVIAGLRKNGEEFPADATISRLEVDGRKLLTVSLRDISEEKLLEDENRLLAEIGRVLIAAGADYERILSDVAGLVASDLADWCAVDIVQAGDLRRLRLVSSNPTQAAICHELERYPVERARLGLVFEAPGTQVAVLVDELPVGYLEAMAQDAEHLRLLRALDPRSLIVAPLIARGHSLGTLTFGTSRPSRRYGPRDLEMAERLASRVALAVDNARLHEALERAVRTRDEVLAIVAHDLRNPLNSIVLEADLVRHQKPETVAKRAVHFADAVTRMVERMNVLIQDLLDTARAEVEGLPIACRAVAPAALLAEVVELQQVLAAEAGLELRMDDSNALPDVWGDAQRLLQVFGNLVGNALKFTPRGGKITLGGMLQDSYVVFRVEDTGPGIPAHLLPHIFDRFWQANRIDRRGAGLGLSIAKNIVDTHGGKIAVESVPGHGTTFRFSVPVAEPAHERAPGSAVGPSQRDASREPRGA